MQDLEPPEVPLELSTDTQAAMQLPPLTETKQDEPRPKKEGFFKRLFSRKDKQEDASKDMQVLPEIDLPQMGNLDMNTINTAGTQEDSGLPELPSAEEQLEELRKNIDVLENENVPAANIPVSVKGKGKGKNKKGQKRDIAKIDESSQFDWMREIQDQEILIHDNNRFNQDVNLLMKNAAEHVDEKSKMTEAAALSSEPNDVDTFVAPIDIQDLKPLSEPSEEDGIEMPVIESKHDENFAKISAARRKIRSELNNFFKDKKLIFPNKSKLVSLLKMYDDNFEKYIEHNDLELDEMKKELKLQSRLKTEDVRPLSEPQVGDYDQMPTVDPVQHRDFVKLSMTHKKLRSALNKYLGDKKLIFPDKSKLVSLLKMYDDNVEKYIEDKELELSKIKRDIKRRESRLKIQEQEVRDMHTYVKDLDEKLTRREAEINDTFTQNVEKELTRRLKDEKTALKTELQKTIALNADLKKKVKIVEDDRARFEREQRLMSETERKKLNELQATYEMKIRDADAERRDFEGKKHAFEERRKASLELLQLADTLSKELKDVKEMKEYVDINKDKMNKDLAEDRELKAAIDNAQKSLAQEKENLDGMIFSKYIENKLKSIRPEYLEKTADWKSELQSNPLYGQILYCKKLLAKNNVNDAKSLYNNIRKAYDQVHVSRKEKEALYNAIRELYNDIQLKVVELQMHGR